ncbi:MAG: hypothetical protein NTZ74_09655 [Chloroflexi bacterium]|nr:hypothetical protein [Chloroflexota bacterium]
MDNKELKKNSKVLLFSVFIVLILGIFGLIMFHQLKHGDFPIHIAWAKEYSENGYLYKMAHPFFAKLVTVVRALLPANLLTWISPLAKQVYDLKAFEISALIVSSLAYLATGLIMLKRVIRDWNIKKETGLYFAGLAVLIIMLLGPIFIFTFSERMYSGYLSANRYDSPTYILLRPFALLIFFGIVDNFTEKWNWKESLLMVLVMMCATLTKPTFTMTIIPAIGLLTLLRIKQFRKINWAYLFFPFALTAFIVLVGQFIINYTGDRGDRIILAPFQAILYIVPNIHTVFFLVLMSLVFPLAVSLLNWKQVKNDFTFQLGWVNLFLGLIVALMFGEEINMGLNNLWNSPTLGAFILFFITVAWWGKDLLDSRQAQKKITKKQIVTSTLLLLHFICGIIYYVAILINIGVNVG